MTAALIQRVIILRVIYLGFEKNDAFVQAL